MKKFLFLLALVLHGTCSAQWTQILPTTVGTFTYYDMSVLAGANGNDTIFVAGTAGAGKPRLYRSYDGGTTWTSLPFFNYNPHSLSELQSVVAFRSGVVLVSGSNINGSWTYRSTDFGQTWNDAETKYGVTAKGKWGPDGAFCGGGKLGQWAYSKDEGLTYISYFQNFNQSSGFAPQLTDSILYSLRADGCICKTSNQAQNWQSLICGVNPNGIASGPNGWFFNPDSGIWCTGNYLIHTENGGLNWDTIAIKSSLIHFADRIKGIIWGGTQVSFSDDGGNIWITDIDTLPTGEKISLIRTNNSAYALLNNILFKKTLITSNDFRINFSQIEVFPNPAKNLFKFKNFSGTEKLEVIDMQGRKVWESIIKKEIEIPLNAGCYQLKISNENQSLLSKKIIINE